MNILNPGDTIPLSSFGQDKLPFGLDIDISSNQVKCLVSGILMPLPYGKAKNAFITNRDFVSYIKF